MKKFLLFAAACVALVACNNKENALNDEPTAPGRQVTISATVEVPSGANAPIRMVSPDASSLSASTITFHWEAGDKVVLTSTNFSEKQLFTIVDNSINDNKANFTGTALSDMSSYLVFYLGKNTSIEKFISIMSSEVDNLTYEADNFHPYLTANTPGNASGFTLDFFHYNIKVPLKGNATVGKIEYYVKNTTPKLTTTMSFGDGLALTDTEVPVYMPLFDASANGFILKIYDTANQLLLEKTVASSVLTDNNSKLVPFEALTVNKVIKGKAKRKLAGGGEVDVDWVQLWAGGPKWATCNVGATTATEYGNYFCWGGTYANGVGIAWTENYNTGSSDIQYTNDDAAKYQWGTNWQLPTKTDFEDLLTNTTYEWTTDYLSSGVNGYLFTGKGDYSDNSIFLPAAGICGGNWQTNIGELTNVGRIGNYWSSNPKIDDSLNAYYLNMYFNGTCDMNNSGRWVGRSVRAILHE